MINEDPALEYYSEEGSSQLENGESRTSELPYDDYEDDTRYRRDQIFTKIDFTKRKTKVACTLGPATSEVQQIVKLLDAGMTIARINLSHGTKKSNARLIKNYRQAKRLRPQKTCTSMLELRGREVRVGRTQNPEGIQFKSGDSAYIRMDDFSLPSTAKNIQANSSELLRISRPGDVLYFDDGAFEAVVRDVEIDCLKIEIKTDGLLKSNVQIKLTSNRYDMLPLITEDDKKDLEEIAIKEVFDYVALPFTLSWKDITQLRTALGNEGKQIGIIAKIDTLEGIH